MKDDTVRRLEALVLELDETEVPVEATGDQSEHGEGRTAA